jgi:hypothetical protein
MYTKILLSPDVIGLSRGDKSEAVRDVHAYLSRFGWLALPGQTPVIAAHDLLPEAEADHFDEATETALTDFQRFYRLPVTGRLDVETLVLMRQPRCGVPDRPIAKDAPSAKGGPAEFVAEATKWSNLRPTWHLSTGTPDLSDATVNDALFRAYRTWSLIAQIAPRGGPAPGDINVIFGSGNHGDSWPFDGVGSTLAHGFPPPPNNGTLAGDLHFDDAETWTTNLPPTGTDLPTVALHEAGHNLGLDHSAVASAVMYAYYGGARRTLTTDDIDGLRSVYGTRNRNIWTNIDTAVDGEGPFTGKAYLFRGNQYLRYDWADDLPDAGYPAKIADGWHGLPAGFTDNFDAALNGQKQFGGKLYLFKGDRYIRYDWASDRTDPGYPQSIGAAWHGLPPGWASGFDAAVGGQGPFAGKAYFFKGNQYIRYDWASDTTDPGYPKSFPGVWPGLPPGFTSNIQAALNGQKQFGGKLYFFKGADYARYDWAADRGDAGYPQPIEFNWL